MLKTILTLTSLSRTAKVKHTQDLSDHQWVAELKNEEGEVVSSRAYARMKEAAIAALAHITLDATL